MTIQHDPKTGRRGIEWCSETRPIFGGCFHECRWKIDGQIAKCYAEELAENGLAKAGYPHGFKHHYYRGEKALRELVAGRAPELIFCDSMADMFGSWIPDEQLLAALEAMGTGGRHHTYQSLTKAVGRITKFANALPPNLWVGCSSAPDFFMGRELTREQQTRYMHKALENLAEVRAARGNIVWMSVEPLSWDVADIIAAHPGVLDWVIIGAASNGRRYYQPEAGHVSRLLDVLDAQGVAVFYKGNIKPLFEVYDFGTAGKNRWREDFPVRAVGDVAGSEPVGPAPAVARRQRLARRYGWTLNTLLADEPPAAEPPARVAYEQELAQIRAANEAAVLADLRALLGEVAGEMEIVLVNSSTSSLGDVYNTHYHIAPAVWHGLVTFEARRWTAADVWEFRYYDLYANLCRFELGREPGNVWERADVLSMLGSLQAQYAKKLDGIVAAARDGLSRAQDWDTFADAQSALMRYAPEREAEWQATAEAARVRIAERARVADAYVAALGAWREDYEMTLDGNRRRVVDAQRALDMEFTRYEVGLAALWTADGDDTYPGGVNIWSLDREPNADGYWRVLDNGRVVEWRLVNVLWVGTAVTEKLLSEAGEGPWIRSIHVHDAGLSVRFLPWDEQFARNLLDKTIVPLPAEPEPPAVFEDGTTAGERNRITEVTRGMAHVEIPF